MKILPAIVAATAIAVPVAIADSPSSGPATAQQQCRTERAQMGAANFAKTYGTNANGKNAFGKCVSKRASATDAAVAGQQTNAAKTCKAARQSDPAAFAQKWGSKPNAYGTCVSTTAKAQAGTQVDDQVQADVSAAKACRAEQKSLGSAAFAQKYGTNKNKRNAFGKCVSAKAKAQPKTGSTEGATS